MTHKDYRKFVKLLASNAGSFRSKEHYAYFVGEFATLLASDNDRFKPDIFIREALDVMKNGRGF